MSRGACVARRLSSKRSPLHTGDGLKKDPINVGLGQGVHQPEHTKPIVGISAEKALQKHSQVGSNLKSRSRVDAESKSDPGPGRMRGRIHRAVGSKPESDPWARSSEASRSQCCNPMSNPIQVEVEAESNPRRCRGRGRIQSEAMSRSRPNPIQSNANRRIHPNRSRS